MLDRYKLKLKLYGDFGLYFIIKVILFDTIKKISKIIIIHCQTSKFTQQVLWIYDQIIYLGP